jgi:SprT-like family
MIKLYNNISDPFAKFLPENSPYCSKHHIDNLHRETCKILDISDIYPEILWSFSKYFRDTLGEASYWIDDTTKKMQWRIKYCSKSWIAIGKAGRRNTIVHEICHLAVEKLYGHKARPKKGEERVEDHGEHWQNLMNRCKEDPFLVINWNYR